MKRGNDKRANDKETLRQLERDDHEAILRDPYHGHFEAVDYARKNRLYQFWNRLMIRHDNEH